MRLKRLICLVPISLLWVAGLLWAERVRLSEGTPVRLRLKADLSSDQANQGDRVDFEVARNVVVRGLVAIPEGSVAWGAVQSAKKKDVKFDIEGLRLPNLRQIKLRSIPEKSSNPGKDQIKADTHFGGSVGAPRGSEYTAYLDEDVETDVAGERPAAAVPAPAPPPPKPVEVKAPPAAPARVVETPAPSSAPAAAVPAPAPQPATVPASRPAAQPPTPTPAPSPPPSPAPQDVAAGGEQVTVECYSDPSGADILVDGDFVGNTPSILKIAVGEHRLEIQRSGYRPFSKRLSLAAGSGLQTVRASLEKKE